MIRRFLVWLHRWVGLLVALFLVVVALTGSVIAFHTEIDGWLNPGLVSVAKRDLPLLDPFTLHDKVVAQFPREHFDMLELSMSPDRAVRYLVIPSTNAGDHDMEHDADHGFKDLQEWFFDPYTGAKLGERLFLSGPTLDRQKVMGFIFRLHYSLSAPWGWNIAGNNGGGFILGVVALAWTIDCFIAFYLTFPLQSRSETASVHAEKSWWSRWKPAWLIKTHSGFYRLNFDLHRALGLWTWIMLFVFAWSGVHFNLDQVYAPSMKALFGAPPLATTASAARPKIENPALGWREAYAQSSQQIRAEAQARGLNVIEDLFFDLSHDTGEYSLTTRFAGDINRRGANLISIDANTGARTNLFFESDLRGADLVTNWLVNLHDAGVFGLVMRIVVCVMGIVITLLSITGIYIWWKKRSARLSRRQQIGITQPGKA